MNLREHLKHLLPQVLPTDPSKAINGTKLLAIVRPQLGSDYADSSIQQHFSLMAADSSSVIAKAVGRHGYYLRVAPEPEPIPEGVPSSAPKGIGSQSEEKFRAFYMRQALKDNQLPMRIDHTRAGRDQLGVNKWKFPDVVFVEWDVGKVDDDGLYFLDSNLLEVRRSLGEQPFRLTSVELKVAITFNNFREHFFQCVSNSRWAHHSVLAIAGSVDDSTLVEELRRLGTSYDVTIVAYGIDAAALPHAEEFDEEQGLTEAQFDKLLDKLGAKKTVIATGRQRPTLDWEHFNDMYERTTEFRSLLEWIARSLRDKRAYTHREYQDLVASLGRAEDIQRGPGRPNRRY